MSQYTASVAGARGVQSQSATSVGDMIESQQVFSQKHPLYEMMTRHFEKQLADIQIREAEKHASAKQAVCTVVLDPMEKQSMQEEFTELRIVWPPWRLSPHPVWEARRQLVNQYMTHHASSYAESFVHYGSSALAYLTAGTDNAALFVDGSSPVAMHENYDDSFNVAKLTQTVGSAAADMAWITNANQMRSYAEGTTLRKHDVAAMQRVQGEALIVDGGLYPLSPDQFITAMLEHRSEIGMFALPYDSSMLVHGEGILPGTDVHYHLDDHDVLFKYPNGVCGVNRYSAEVWHKWLFNVTRGIPGIEHCSFQFELMGVRGSFMVVRVVRVDSPVPEKQEIHHSLQLENMSERTLVKTWVLRDLKSDISKASSWKQVCITVPTRVLEKTHDYAMSLDANSFSRYAIRKRLQVVNDRVVVQGTTVHVSEAMTADDLNVLEIALFVHCFVARYEANKLAAGMRKIVDDVAGFNSLSVLSRMGHVLLACAYFVYDWTLGIVDDLLRRAFDFARSLLSRNNHVKERPSFEPAPSFIKYETVLYARGNTFLSSIKRILFSKVTVTDLIPGLPGFRFAASLNAYRDETPFPLPLINLDFVVSMNAASSLYQDYVDTSVTDQFTSDGAALYQKMRQLNPVDQDDGTRHHMMMYTETPNVGAVDTVRDEYAFDPGYITTLEEYHEAAIPGMRDKDFKYDLTSIATDDQDRSLAADRLVLPLDMASLPSTMEVYPGRLKGYDVTKRPHVLQDTLSAIQARNLSAPVLALPQDEQALVHEVFEDFLNIACVPEAREMLVKYACDPVAMEEQAMMDWTGKARPENVVKVFKHLVDNPHSWEELKTWEYNAMIKSDVKPPLTDKPIHGRVEPQVIVHHIGDINAIFSSIFRVLVRRFLSLLKPNFMLNLLKDMDQVRDCVQNNHDWSATNVMFLENDFSKYDKSQGEFVHVLETYVFERLGMNKEMLELWGLGHVECTIHSVAVGLSLNVQYQRKSGDATTAFGNGILNMMSVLHVYKPSDIIWGVFMGDDSLIAARTMCAAEVSVRALAEKFNLQAKFFVTEAPYFASTFLLFHRDERRVVCVPDPIKRIEKWSMAVAARDPKWEERYISAVNSLSVYRNRTNLVGLGKALQVRYALTDTFDVDSVGDAIASAIRSQKEFRALWENDAVSIKF